MRCSSCLDVYDEHGGFETIPVENIKRQKSTLDIEKKVINQQKHKLFFKSLRNIGSSFRKRKTATLMVVATPDLT